MLMFASFFFVLSALEDSYCLSAAQMKNLSSFNRRALTSHQCGLGSTPDVVSICGLSLFLVLSLAPRGFSLGTPVFPPPQKPTFQIPI